MFDCDNKRFINLEPYEIRKAKLTTLNYFAYILKMKGKICAVEFQSCLRNERGIYKRKRARSNYPPKKLKTIPEKR
jgi:hypothetical protein